jgi:hypothetical protein
MRSMERGNGRIGWHTLVGLGVVVLAFMAVSLAVTATGTSRFAVAMGYDAKIGYAIGAIFDLGSLLIGAHAYLEWPSIPSRCA